MHKAPTSTCVHNHGNPVYHKPTELHIDVKLDDGKNGNPFHPWMWIILHKAPTGTCARIHGNPFQPVLYMYMYKAPTSTYVHNHGYPVCHKPTGLHIDVKFEEEKKKKKKKGGIPFAHGWGSIIHG